MLVFATDWSLPFFFAANIRSRSTRQPVHFYGKQLCIFTAKGI